MADLHIIGQISSASDFLEPNLFCKWSLQFGSNWTCVEGIIEGQSITDSSKVIDRESVFVYPLDIHLSCRGIQGWPKLHVEIWTKNSLEQCWPVGFGVAHIPSRPGHHKVVINTWKLTTNSFWDDLTDKFHGGGFALNKSDLIYSGSDRYRISTKSAGSVTIELMVIFQNFSKYGIEV